MPKSEILATHTDSQSYYLDSETKAEGSTIHSKQTSQISSKNLNYSPQPNSISSSFINSQQKVKLTIPTI